MIVVTPQNVVQNYPSLKLPVDITYPCPFDGIGILSPVAPNVQGLKIIPARKRSPYMWRAFLPHGMVNWSPKYPGTPAAELWINSSKHCLTKKMVLTEAQQLFSNVNSLKVGRFDAKIDLLDIQMDDVFKGLWPRRRRRVISYSTTKYFGSCRKSGEIKVYDKALQAKVNIPIPLTRIEVLTRVDVGKRPSLQDFLSNPLVGGNPFSSVSLIDVTRLNGKYRPFKYVKKYGIQAALASKILSTADKNKIRKAAQGAELLSLKDEYVNLVQAWQ